MTQLSSPLSRGNPPPTRPAGHVLIVEDELSSFQTVERLLRKRGWVVSRARNPVEAMAALRSARIDLVLIDRRLHDPEAEPETWAYRDGWGDPSRAGDVLLRRVAAQHPDICPIVLTVLDDYADARRATSQGARDYIVKGDRGTEATFADNLSLRMRAALRVHKLHRLRHRSLRFLTFTRLLEHVFAFIRDELPTAEFNLFFLQVEPGGAFITMRDANNPLPLARPVDHAWFLLNPTALMAFVLETRLTSSIDDPAALQPQAITADAVYQFLAPALICEHPDRDHLRVEGILALESTAALTWTDADREFLTALAALLADFVAAHGHARHREQEVTRSELAMAAAAVARHCSILQIAQSGLDLLRDRLEQGEPLQPDSVRGELNAALAALESAALATENLRLGQLDLVLHPEPSDLAELARRAARLQQTHLKLAGVELDLTELRGSVLIELDPRQTVYVLEGLIRETAQTALRERQEKPPHPGQPLIHRLVLAIEVDPEAHQTARLQVRDDGPGWPDELLRGDYYGHMERYLPQGLADNRGLALWEAARFTDRSGGRMLVRNGPGGGAMIEFFFPLARTDSGQGAKS